MRCRHTLPLLLLALSSTFGLGLATHSRPHAHSRPSKTRKNHALEATTNSSVYFNLPESPGGQCPRGRRGPPPLSELQTMLDSYARLDELSPTRAPLTCLSAPRQPCPGDPCAPEGLCSPAGPDVRLRRARQLRLENCPHLTFFSVMSTEDRKALEDATSCCALVRHLKERDAIVRNFLDINDVLLRRSNFNNDCELGGPRGDVDFYGGSPKRGCVTCEEAYRRWVCSQLFVFHDGEGCPVKPCASVCHCVEQKCPYFLPLYKPVAGEPSFFCEDYSSGFQEQGTMAHSHGHSSENCYEPCSPPSALGRLHERTNVTEFALCVHARGQHKDSSPPHVSAGSQCLSDSGSDCGCKSQSRQNGVVSGVPVKGILWTCLSLVALSRTLFLRPRGFT